MNRFLPPVIVVVGSMAGIAQTTAVHTFMPDRFHNTFSFAHPPGAGVAV